MFDLTKMLEALQQPNAYAHEVQHVKLLETYTSWVFLTGEYAYKIKRPVNFDFLDYSTLEKRKHYCEQEIKLNQFLAQSIYLKVVPVTKTSNGFEIDGNGEIVEYAVQMKEFSQDYLLSNLLKKGELTPEIVEEIAMQLALFHLETSHAAPETEYGTPESAHQPVEQNFAQSLELLQKYQIANETYLAPLEELEIRSYQEYNRIKPILASRKTQGFIRSCHGDIHLGNITLLQGHPVIFDCIEFNEYFRWTDVMADVGFLLMDFFDNHRPDLGILFLNTYLAYTGDYAGLAVLPYYFAYRAMVRAKVQLFSTMPEMNERERHAHFQKYLNYVLLAQSYFDRAAPFILVMHGFSGSGKTTLAKKLAVKTQAIVVHSDVERKRLFDLLPHENSRERLENSIYHSGASLKTYEQLNKHAETIVNAHYPVIVDATFINKSARESIVKLAKDLHVPYIFVSCEAPEKTLSERISSRKAEGMGFSEADEVAVLEQQANLAEPLADVELEHVVFVKTNVEWDIDKIMAIILEKLRTQKELTCGTSVDENRCLGGPF